VRAHTNRGSQRTEFSRRISGANLKVMDRAVSTQTANTLNVCFVKLLGCLLFTNGDFVVYLLQNFTWSYNPLLWVHMTINDVKIE